MIDLVTTPLAPDTMLRETPHAHERIARSALAIKADITSKPIKPKSTFRIRPVQLAGRVWLGLIMLFIYAPIIVVIGASLDKGQSNGLSAFLQFPPRGLTLDWYFAIKPALWASLWFSVKLAFAVMIAAIVLAFPSSLVLVKSKLRASPLVEAIFRAPLQIPFIVTGVAFLQAYYFIARHFNIPLPGSFLGLFLGHLFVAVPYVSGAVIVSLKRLDFRLEEAAQSLGAPYWRVLLRVTLPLIMPGIFAGGLYAFLVSFTDVTLSIMLSGQNTVPFPVWIMSAINNDLDATVPAISTLVFIVSLGIIFLLQKILGVETVALSGKNVG